VDRFRLMWVIIFDLIFPMLSDAVQHSSDAFRYEPMHVRCSPMLSDALRCSPMLSDALRCSPMLSDAFRCFSMRTDACPMLTDAFRCLSDVSRCVPMLVRSCPMLSDAFLCLADASRCLPMLPMLVQCFPMLSDASFMRNMRFRRFNFFLQSPRGETRVSVSPRKLPKISKSEIWSR
jgi:hypothetical protein